MRTLSDNIFHAECTHEQDKEQEKRILALEHQVGELTESVSTLSEQVDSPVITKSQVTTSQLIAGTTDTETLLANRIETDLETASTLIASTITAGSVATQQANLGAFVAQQGTVHELTSDNITTDTITTNSIQVTEFEVGSLTTDAIVSQDIMSQNVKSSAVEADGVTASTLITGAATADYAVIADITASTLITDTATLRHAKIRELEQCFTYYEWQFQDITSVSSDTGIVVIALPEFVNGDYSLVYKNPNNQDVIFAAIATNTYSNPTVTYYKKILLGGESLSRIAFKDNQIYFETKVPGRLYYTCSALGKATPPESYGEWPINPEFADVYEVARDRATVFTHYANVGTSGEEYGTASFDYVTTDNWGIVHEQQEEAPIISYNPGHSVVGRTYVPDQNVNKGSDVEFEDIVSSTLVTDAIESRAIDTDTLTASSIVTSSLVAGTGVMASLSVQHGIEASSLITSSLAASTLTASSARVARGIEASSLVSNGIETSTLSTNRLTVASQIVASQANGIFNNIDTAMTTAQRLRVAGISELEGNVTIGTALAGADLVVNGNIIQQGETYETHAEQVYTKKDHIILRDSSVSGLIPDEHSGLIVKKYDGTNDLHIGTKNDGVLRVGTAAENTETHQYACYSANGTNYFADPALSMSVANPDIVSGSGKPFYEDSGRYREIDNTVYYDSVALDPLTDSLVFTSESADQTEGTLTEVTGYVYEVTTHSPGTVTVNRSFGPVASINGTTLYSDLACTKPIASPVLSVTGQAAKVYWISADEPILYSPDAGVTWFKNAVYHPSTNTITVTGPVAYTGVALSRQVYANSTYEEVISTFPPAMMRAEEPGYDGLLIWDHAKMAADTLSMPTAADYAAAGSDTLALVRTREPTTGRQWYEWGETGSGTGNGTTLVLTQSEYDTYSLITDMADEHYIPNNALVIITDSEDEYLTAQEE